MKILVFDNYDSFTYNLVQLIREMAPKALVEVHRNNEIALEIVRQLGNPIVSSSIHDDDAVLEYSTDPELIFEKWQDLVDVVIDGGYGDNIGSTIIEREVKIDNLVHIAHGVHIESNSLIIAHAMIAGSVKIGKNTWVAPCSAIKQKVSIGDNVIIGLGSVVLKDVQNNEVVVGVPAKNIIK